IEDDVEDYIHAARMRLVNELCQLLLGGRVRAVGREPLVDIEEVLGLISVVVVREIRLGVLENGRKPDGSYAELLEISELCLHTLERAALAEVEPSVPSTLRPLRRVVEPVDEQKVDPAVAPVPR